MPLKITHLAKLSSGVVEVLIFFIKRNTTNTKFLKDRGGGELAARERAGNGRRSLGRSLLLVAVEVLICLLI